MYHAARGIESTTTRIVLTSGRTPAHREPGSAILMTKEPDFLGPSRAARRGRFGVGLIGRPAARRHGRAAEGGYRTMILTSIHDIDATRWDALVGAGGITRSHAYLAAVESAGIAGSRFFYPVIFNARNEMVAHACVATVVTDFAQLLPAALQRLARGIRRAWPGFLRVRITECAVPLVAGHPVSLRADAPRDLVMRRVADAAHDIARTQGSPIVLVRDLLPEHAADIATLLAHGFHKVANMPLARIDVRWRSHAAYLEDMRPRYRKDVERRLRRARAAGLSVVDVCDYATHADTWCAQARGVFESAQRFKREMITPDYYRQVAHTLGERSRLFAVLRDGRPVAHGLIVFDATQTVATFFGREPGPPGYAWFLLADEVLRFAIARGSRYLQLGLGSYPAKGLIGATFEPLAICCRSRHAWLNLLMRLKPDLVNAGRQATPRIFRDQVSRAACGTASSTPPMSATDSRATYASEPSTSASPNDRPSHT